MEELVIGQILRQIGDHILSGKKEEVLLLNKTLPNEIRENASFLLQKNKYEKLIIFLDNEYSKLLKKMYSKELGIIDKSESPFLFSRHTLAYYCWKKAELEGKIEKATVIHIDSHRDITPFNKKELEDYKEYENDLNNEKDINKKLDLIKDFSINNLWIDNFLTAALSDSQIKELFWIVPKNIKAGFGPDYIKRCYFENNGFFKNFNKNRTPLNSIYAEELPEIKGDVILDIDLDYFSCKEGPINIATEGEIVRSINELTAQLKKRNIAPKIITISLSHDYTPENQIDFIKNELMRLLINEIR